MMFQRTLDKKTIDALKKEPLFKKRLLPDIERGRVFPAIRGGYIDFYHKGGRLFTFKKEFCTHKKYASVIRSKGDYLTESDLEHKIELICDFSDGYESIKENCSLYPGVEAEGVSALYHKYSYARNDSDVVVLDIEISFKSEDADKSQDRIDILLYNKKKKMLRFYEAKHFSNDELWSKSGTKPRVIKQIKGYNEQVKKRHSEILSQYKNYFRVLNEIFGRKLFDPVDGIDCIDENVALLVFGFDRNQQRGRMKELLLDDRSLENIQHYFIGNISSVNINNMWNKVNCG